MPEQTPIEAPAQEPLALPRFHWALRLLVSVAVLIWLITSLNPGELLAALSYPHWAYLGLMVVCAWIFLVLGGLKIWVLLSTLKPIPFPRVLGRFLIASSLGAFTPANLGEFSLVALLRKDEIPLSQSAAILVVDRAITLLLYAGVFLPLTLNLISPSPWLWGIPSTLILACLFVWVVNNSSYFRSWAQSFIRRRPVQWLGLFLQSVSQLIRYHPWQLFSNLVVAVVRCAMGGAVVQFALQAAGERVDFLPVLFTSNAISLLNLLPVSLSGLGLYEGGGVAIFQSLGFHAERIFAGLAYQRLYIILSSLLITMFAYLPLKKLKRK
ncbi:MAG: lysylphosphatidylglycerol synthase transmembrane domain-containing protein [Chloroflexota bacterium]